MKIIKSTLDLDLNDKQTTVMRAIPGEGDDQTKVLPNPEETLVVKRNDPHYEGVPTANSFCSRAASLLSLVPKLRMLPAHDNIKNLYEQLVKEIKDFETADPASGTSEKENKIASYFICALLDETILNTPWGRQHKWEKNSLLKHFHRDGQEGKKFFAILKQLLKSPAQYIQLVELAYICMSLGYEGFYGKSKMPSNTIAQHRQKLYRLIQHVKKADDNIPLSTNWEGIKGKRKYLKLQFPLWVSLVISGVLLMLIYFSVIYVINRDSDLVAEHIDQIARKETVLPSTPQPMVATDDPSLDQETPVATAPKAIPPVPVYNEDIKSDPVINDKDKLSINQIKKALSNEIEKKQLEVLEGPTLRITNAFLSGSDTVKDDFVPMLKHIAKLISAHDVRVLVVGHTDNQPMFSGRFPSNWHLSEARAKSVADQLAQTKDITERIRFEGHGASEPIAPNDTAKNRALNRRIEIHIR